MITQLSFTPVRQAINDAYRMDETQCVHDLISLASLTEAELKYAHDLAYRLVDGVREERLGKGGLDAFLYEYDLSTEEGIALMCIAEAMLRIPDSATIDKLIADKLGNTRWEDHLGDSESLFVNTATWALMLTGKIVETPEREKKNLRHALRRLVKRSGEAVIRGALAQAMQILGRQFVMGRTIEEAVKRANALEQKGYRYSYDMLGEAARTAEDADHYYQAYENAIAVIAASNQKKSPSHAASISIKLSALHPRYEYSQRDRILKELMPKVLKLAQLAARSNVGLTIDAEEADRLDLSLDIIEHVFPDASLQGWGGFGLAVQSYQKRASFVIDWLIDLAKTHQRRLNVRLVKGAYWDTEIKQAQVDGLKGYPVFTRKANTDVSYLACAKKLLEATDTIYPQFATHNAYSLAAILAMLPRTGRGESDLEFQCLHGMGDTLYNQVVGKDKLNFPCRIYAPVGNHKDLLPYLVRRLLENGANSSFVNRIVDSTMPIEAIISNPVGKIYGLDNKAHPKIPPPKQLYGATRENSQGFDFSARHELNELADAMTIQEKQLSWEAKPSVADPDASIHDILNPATGEAVGRVHHSSSSAVSKALAQAVKAWPTWNATAIDVRADLLLKTAALLHKEHAALMTLLVREAGKTLLDADSEIREAIDFCRYYAEQSAHLDDAQTARGIIACISPWNFPLAIFIGQVSAALAAGNCVMAKPAEQTSLVASYAIDLLYQAGIPRDVLHYLPGRGSAIGSQLSADARVDGVMFTGSTETAQLINKNLAERETDTIFVAETGGQNAMIVDSSALLEQVVDDVLLSAFGSAGQRCSALRVLFVQADIADNFINMLRGAIKELRMGDPSLLSTDVGPVIDARAQQELAQHAAYLKSVGQFIASLDDAVPTQGTFFAPCAYEILDLNLLSRENFGPILHVIRYQSQDLEQVINAVNASGYGLTMGVHSRIESTVKTVCAHACVGNLYINRNMIGAVVGVQPFGGENLSGTGPKAGGPHYLPALRTNKQDVSSSVSAFDSEKGDAIPLYGSVLSRARRSYGHARFERLAVREQIFNMGLDRLLQETMSLSKHIPSTADELQHALQSWRDLLDLVHEHVAEPMPLPGPTGESNQLSLRARGVVLIVALDKKHVSTSLAQFCAVLLMGNSVLIYADRRYNYFWHTIFQHLHAVGLELDRCQVIDNRYTLNSLLIAPELSLVMLDTHNQALVKNIRVQLAARDGKIIPLITPVKLETYLERVSVERTLTINTTATGGNAALLSLQED